MTAHPRIAAALVALALPAVSVPAAAVPVLRADDGRVVELRCDRVNTLRIDARGSAGVVVRPAAGCRTAALDGADPVGRFRPMPGRAGVWAARLAFRPAQVTAAGRLLDSAHSPRARSGNPWVTVRGATAGTITLSRFATRCTSFAGATLRVRTSLYEIDEAPVTGSRGFTLDAAGLEGARGWGATLEGPACLLDEPGEWAYAGGRLLVFSRRPPASVRAARAGAVIDGRGSRGLRVERIAVRGAATGIAVGEGAADVTLDRVRVTDAADHAVDAECVEGLVMRGSALARTGRDGLHVGYCGREVAVTGSSFTDIGMELTPRKGEAAVFGGLTDGLTVTGSTFRRTQYIAVRGHRRAVIRGNRIFDACAVLEDCGAIYLWNRDPVRLDAEVSGNLIDGVRGNPWGRERGEGNWWRDGASFAVYLDDRSDHVTVSGNTLRDYQHGLELHGATNNVIEGNRFEARVADAHVFMNADIPGDPQMSGNVIRGNTFVATTGPVYRVYAPFGNIATLARFGANTYPAVTPFAEVAGTGDIGLPRWRSLTGDPG